MYACTLVISQSVNFGSHHRTSRTYMHVHVHIVPRTYTEYARSRRSPRVSGDDGGERCGPRREKTEKNSEKEGRPEEKKLYVQLPIPPTPRESGIPLASQRLPFSPSARGSKFFMRNELISFFRLKKKTRAPSWGKKRRIKNREMNANTFYILQKHTSYAPLACFLRKLVELFCRKSGVVHLFECTFQ